MIPEPTPDDLAIDLEAVHAAREVTNRLLPFLCLDAHGPDPIALLGIVTRRAAHAEAEVARLRKIVVETEANS